MDQNKDFSRYEDMLDLPHHVSEGRAHMSLHDRAAQFAPFAALTGYDAAIEEAGRLTDLQAELDESRKEVLNEQISFLRSVISQHPMVSVTWFADDERKTGGAYVHSVGKLIKYDETERLLILENDARIPVDRIHRIESEFLDEREFPPLP